MSEAIYFDNAASDYDMEFTRSTIGILQRYRVWNYLKPILASKNKPLAILEINCGTGVDAIRLSEMGHHVTATDGSRNMVDVAMEKVKNINENKSLKFEQCEFSALSSKYKSQKFDLIFSDFGGLNCVSKEELKKLSTDFSEMLNPDGSLIFVIMGTRCTWEQIYFLLKGKTSTAFRRKQIGGVKTLVKSTAFKTWYFSPSEIKNIFKTHFNNEFTKPIGLFIPPSYLEPFFIKRKTFLTVLNRFENVFGNIGLFSNLADHYFIHLTKKGE